MAVYYLACFMTVMVYQTETLKIESEIVEYFSSDDVQSFKIEWEKYRKPLENAILRAIKENYGSKGMNVYVRRMQNPYQVSRGYYHSDNQVQIVLEALELDELPYLWMPEVTFSLPLNLLQIGASLSKMIIRCNYIAFRNKSDIIYDVKDQNIYENSPFRFQQVENTGQLGITIEGCVLTGITIATLADMSVNLGFNSLKLSKCQYTFEISTPGSGSPPVVAKYYPMGVGLTIEDLLLRSLREELMPKLQATMFSFVNTSGILGDNLPQLRQKQEQMFRNTSKFMNNVVRNLNRIAIEKNSGAVNMEDFKLFWTDPVSQGAPANTEISFTDMVMSGLETAYSSHTGGPYQQTNPKVSEEIRYNFIRIRGNISYTDELKHEYSFVAEIEDVGVEISLNINKLFSRRQSFIQLQLNATNNHYHVNGWRRLELSIPRAHFNYADQLVTGFLLHSVPQYIINHLNENFDEALQQANSNKTEKLNFEKRPKENVEPASSEPDGEADNNEFVDQEMLHKNTSEEKVNEQQPSGEGTESVLDKNDIKVSLNHESKKVAAVTLIDNEYGMVVTDDEAHSRPDGLLQAESSDTAPSRVALAFNEINTG